MREKIKEIYNDKATAYLAVLDKFDEARIDYVLLNILVADDNPGDLDILFCNYNQNVITQILCENGFSYYAKYEKGQYLWNKYLKGIGFVQFHIYECLQVGRRDYFPICNININLQYNFAFHFFIFIIETLYKGILRKEQYKQYKQACNVELLKKYVKENSPTYLDSVDYVVKCYEENEEINPSRRNHYLWQGNRINKYLILLWKSIRRIKNLFRQDNISVLFIGVDGAGKTTLIDLIYKIFAKGGIFPQKRYLGLRESLFTPKGNGISKKNSISEKLEIYRHPLNLLRFIKLLLYWGEYNVKYLVNVKLHPYGSRTTFLIDRCYFDLLFYYPYPIVRELFIRYSLIPDKVVFLTGDRDILYGRKKEMEKKRFDMNYNFYYKLISNLTDKYNKSVFYIDTTIHDLNETKISICDYIMGV